MRRLHRFRWQARSIIPPLSPPPFPLLPSVVVIYWQVLPASQTIIFQETGHAGDEDMTSGMTSETLRSRVSRAQGRSQWRGTSADGVRSTGICSLDHQCRAERNTAETEDRPRRDNTTLVRQMSSTCQVMDPVMKKEPSNCGTMFDEGWSCSASLAHSVESQQRQPIPNARVYGSPSAVALHASSLSTLAADTCDSENQILTSGYTMAFFNVSFIHDQSTNTGLWKTNLTDSRYG